MKLVIASNNSHKVEEIKKILGNYFTDIYSMRDVGLEMEIKETGTTFEENSYIKASAVCKATNLTALADDSGLCVNCLDGAPGVYSARYAGEEQNDNNNIDKLLSVLKDKDNRCAKFVTAITVVTPDGKKIVAIGETKGKITKKRMGKGGFGYDPVFFSDELGKTFGEATADEKNSVSHRGKALNNLIRIIRKEI